MKMRSLSSVLMSAYLSAMLASSLAPIAGNVTLAGTVNPAAAQAAFREALIGAKSAGWSPDLMDAPAPPAAEARMVAHIVPQADPIISDELLARLLKQMAGQQSPASIPAGVCKYFKLCDGTAKLPMRMVQTTNPGGDYMAQPWDAPADTLVVARRMPDNSVQFYLTDKKSRKLLSAASSVNGVPTVLDVAVVNPDFEAALAHLAKEAAVLPPAGTSVASAGS